MISDYYFNLNNCRRLRDQATWECLNGREIQVPNIVVDPLMTVVNKLFDQGPNDCAWRGGE